MQNTNTIRFVSGFTMTFQQEGEESVVHVNGDEAAEIQSILDSDISPEEKSAAAAASAADTKVTKVFAKVMANDAKVVIDVEHPLTALAFIRRFGNAFDILLKLNVTDTVELDAKFTFTCAAEGLQPINFSQLRETHDTYAEISSVLDMISASDAKVVH